MKGNNNLTLDLRVFLSVSKTFLSFKVSYKVSFKLTCKVSFKASFRESFKVYFNVSFKLHCKVSLVFNHLLQLNHLRPLSLMPIVVLGLLK